MIKIDKVYKNSVVGKKGIKAGDNLISINDQEINDRLDFLFYSADTPLKAKFEQDGQIKEVTISAEDEELGIEVADFKIKHCGNKCVFCFVDQNKPGMRNTLYIKDEDYRFSFLYGNYFTMTNITQKELDRIVSQRLSPLYVSVHAVDNEIRKKLLGIKKDDRFLEKLKYLTENGIQIHTQIVLCPGLNDGKILAETIETLAGFYPKVASLAVVPVGLTKHREGLTELRLFTKEEARKVIEQISSYQDNFLDDFGTNFVFPADEFFLKGELPIPADEYYEEYEQYENGVGMVRSYLEDLKIVKKRFPKKLKKTKTICLVTGKSFKPVIKKNLLPELNKITNLTSDILAITNNLLGKTITVSGLISGQDIITQVKERYPDKIPDLITLPNTCINSDGILLDDISPAELSKELQTKVVVINDFESFIKELIL